MAMGTKATLLLCCLASCSAGNAIKVRAAADPVMLSKDNALDLARAQLMLGNVGLALEGFRKALRDNPSDTAVLAGIGDCYAAMNRYDLAQSSYEQALALSPHDRSLLLGVAGIFDQEGQHAKALIARAEAAAAVTQQAPQRPITAQTAKRPPVVASLPPERPMALGRAAIGSITVELPAARQAKRLSGRAIEAKEQLIAPATTEKTLVRPLAGKALSWAPAPETTAAVTVESAGIVSAEKSRGPGIPPGRTRTETESAAIKLADVQIVSPAEHKPQQDLIALLLSQTAPAITQDRPRHRSGANRDGLVAPAPGPRLERLSRGEVALITTSMPVWRDALYRRANTATTAAWVPLKPTPSQANVQILNATRKQGLAAAARSLLVNRGWRKIAVGDAAAVQHRSVVLYPADRKTIGRRLAAQFGIGSQVIEGKAVVLILGRDAVSRIAGRRTS